MVARPREHADASNKDDDTLRAEARAHLAAEPPLQLLAEIWAKLRAMDLPFWSPAVLRERWSATERLRWMRDRPDIRQRITTHLTGLAPKAARKKTPDFQAALIDSVLDEGDVAVRTFEEAFDPSEIAVYGPAAAFWRGLLELFPWGDDAAPHQHFMAWLLKALVADGAGTDLLRDTVAHSGSIDPLSRVPILTAWDVRTAIDGRVWHTKVPLDVRVAIDDARFQRERDRPGMPFHAQDDLAIAVAEIIAASVPLADLKPVLMAAGRAMGIAHEAKPAEPKPAAAPIAPPPKPSPLAGESHSAAAAASAPPPAVKALSADPPGGVGATSVPPPAVKALSADPPGGVGATSAPPPAVKALSADPPGGAISGPPPKPQVVEPQVVAQKPSPEPKVAASIEPRAVSGVGEPAAAKLASDARSSDPGQTKAIAAAEQKPTPTPAEAKPALADPKPAAAPETSQAKPSAAPAEPARAEAKKSAPAEPVAERRWAPTIPDIMEARMARREDGDTHEEDLARTNPWVVPTAEEIAAAEAAYEAEGGRRRRGKT